MDQINMQAPVQAATPKHVSGLTIFIITLVVGICSALIIAAAFFLAFKSAPNYSAQLSSISENLNKVAASNNKPEESSITEALNGYQAVFLTNGQVYFGKYKHYNSEYVSLTDIYYLQNGSNLQNGQSSAQQPQISLVKLGNELHGPQDRMLILKSSVMFVENLKEDGNIVRAIQQYKANP